MFHRTLRRLARTTIQRSTGTVTAATATSGSQQLVPPYPTEGGHVPIYSMAHGLVLKRNWVFRNAEWCDLCKEPVAQWVNHQGRKDHALMDSHYTQMMEMPRRWNPKEVLETFMQHLNIDCIEPYHAMYATYDKQHRNEVYAMLVKLEEAGMLYFGEPKQTYLHRMQGGLRGMDHQGALVLHECILGPFMRLYPDGHIQDFSNLVDFVTCSYNMETVYDLCGMYTLDKVALKAQYKPSSPAAMGLGGIASSSSATTGFQNEVAQADSTVGVSHRAKHLAGAAGGAAASPRQVALRAAQAARQQENREEEAFSRKAVFLRQVLGQLRWLMLPEQEHPAGFTFPPHIITIGELCLKALVVEIIAARLCEYMVRVEPVWRAFGYERRRLDLTAVLKRRDDVVPEPVKYFYRSMSPRMDDLYGTNSSFLDGEVRRGLEKKGLPVLPEFAENLKPVSVSLMKN